METLIIFNCIVVIVSAITILIYHLRYKQRLIKEMVDSVNSYKLELVGCFTTPVIEVYLDVLKNPNDWNYNDYRIINKKLKIDIWIANDIHDRKFYKNYFDYSVLEETMIDQKNRNMTYYDKLLLDKLAKALKNKQSLLVTKLFV